MRTDPVERIIELALDRAGIAHRRSAAGLDFHLVASGIEIECKRMHSPRIADQMSRAANVIVVQGMDAAHLLASWIKTGKGAGDE